MVVHNDALAPATSPAYAPAYAPVCSPVSPATPAQGSSEINESVTSPSHEEHDPLLIPDQSSGPNALLGPTNGSLLRGLLSDADGSAPPVTLSNQDGLQALGSEYMSLEQLGYMYGERANNPEGLDEHRVCPGHLQAPQFSHPPLVVVNQSLQSPPVQQLAQQVQRLLQPYLNPHAPMVQHQQMPGFPQDPARHPPPLYCVLAPTSMAPPPHMEQQQQPRPSFMQGPHGPQQQQQKQLPQIRVKQQQQQPRPSFMQGPHGPQQQRMASPQQQQQQQQLPQIRVKQQQQQPRLSFMQGPHGPQQQQQQRMASPQQQQQQQQLPQIRVKQQQQQPRLSFMQGPHGPQQQRMASPQQQQQQQQLRQIRPKRMATGPPLGTSPNAKRRMDTVVPDRRDNADWHVSATRKRTDTGPVINSVEGSKIHLTDSITMSAVGRPGAAVTATPIGAAKNKSAAKAVANVLASQRMPTGRRNNNVRATNQRQMPPRPVQTNVVERPPRLSRPPHPPTVDLTGDGPTMGGGNLVRGRPPGSGGGGGRNRCQMCDTAFSTEESLAQHMQLHRSPGQLSYRCNLCPAQYPTLQGLGHHGVTQHTQHLAPATGPTELALPVVDLMQPGTLSCLASMGIQHYLPLSQLSSHQGGLFGFPIVTLDGARNPAVCNLGALGATNILSLGPMKPLPR